VLYKSLLIVLTTLTLGAQSLSEITKPSPYKDFGKYGKTFPILEKDIEEEIEKQVKNFKYDSSNIQEKITEQVKESAYESTSLSLCLKDNYQKPVIDYATLPEDVINPFGRKIYSKGEKIESNIPSGRELNLCFIDARNMISASNQINFLKKKKEDCLFIVANKNVLALREKFPEEKIFPTSKSQEERFNLKCYPALLHMEKNTIEKNYYSYEQFKN